MRFRQYPIILLLALGIFTGCNDATNPKTQVQHYDAEKLLLDKCAACHNSDMPPQTSETEKAPPMYTITVHLKDWIKAETDTEKKQRFIAFLQTYILHPTRESSYCDKKSLDKYGLMPSQKGNVSKEEIGAIAAYIYQRYDQMKMLALVKERNRIARLPLHEQVLESYDCKLCHIYGNGKLAPTFAMIGEKYGVAGKSMIKNAILHGSKGKWKAFHTPMKAYPSMNVEQLNGMVDWISKQR